MKKDAAIFLSTNVRIDLDFLIDCPLLEILIFENNSKNNLSYTFIAKTKVRSLTLKGVSSESLNTLVENTKINVLAISFRNKYEFDLSWLRKFPNLRNLKLSNISGIKTPEDELFLTELTAFTVDIPLSTEQVDHLLRIFHWKRKQIMIDTEVRLIRIPE